MIFFLFMLLFSVSSWTITPLNCKTLSDPYFMSISCVCVYVCDSLLVVTIVNSLYPGFQCIIMHWLYNAGLLVGLTQLNEINKLENKFYVTVSYRCCNINKYTFVVFVKKQILFPFCFGFYCHKETQKNTSW